MNNYADSVKGRHQQRELNDRFRIPPQLTNLLEPTIQPYPGSSGTYELFGPSNPLVDVSFLFANNNKIRDMKEKY